jgi:hypothetical protein
MEGWFAGIKETLAVSVFKLIPHSDLPLSRIGTETLRKRISFTLWYMHAARHISEMLAYQPTTAWSVFTEMQKHTHNTYCYFVMCSREIRFCTGFF